MQSRNFPSPSQPQCDTIATIVITNATRYIYSHTALHQVMLLDADARNSASEAGLASVRDLCQTTDETDHVHFHEKSDDNGTEGQGTQTNSGRTRRINTLHSRRLADAEAGRFGPNSAWLGAARKNQDGPASWGYPDSRGQAAGSTRGGLNLFSNDAIQSKGHSYKQPHVARLVDAALRGGFISGLAQTDSAYSYCVRWSRNTLIKVDITTSARDEGELFRQLWQIACDELDRVVAP